MYFALVVLGSLKQFFAHLRFKSYSQQILFTFFSIKISEIAKFDSDFLLKTNEDIAPPQSREILQTFVWLGAQMCPRPLPPTIQTSVKFSDFADLTI